GDVPPAEHLLAFLADDLLDDPLALVPLVDLGREEHHADAVLARRGQLDAERLRLATQERVGHLHQDAGAVAGERIAAACAPVRQVLEDREALLDDVVRALALDVHHEADAAGVVLDAWIPQPARPSVRHATLSEAVPRFRSSAARAGRGSRAP